MLLNFKDVLKDALKLNFTNAKCKINDEAVILLNETLKAMLVETVLRASEPPNEPKRLNITLDAVEKVLPQIVSFRRSDMNLFLTNNI